MWGFLRIILLVANAGFFAYLVHVMVTREAPPYDDPDYWLAWGMRPSSFSISSISCATGLSAGEFPASSVFDKTSSY
jgi:hypothetical protein